MKLLTIFCALLSTADVGAAQTSVNLRTQSKNADFSNAAFTSPFKAGTTLPATCTVGNAFFQTTASAGQNLFLCTAANTWTVVNGSGGGSALPFTTQTAASKVSIVNGAPAVFGCNGANVAAAAGTTTIVPATGTATETLLIGISCLDLHIVLVAPTNTFSCTLAGFSACDGVTGNALGDGVIPLAAVAMTTGQAGSFTFGQVTDFRAPLQDDPLTAGTGIAYTKSGSSRTLAADTTVLPQKFFGTAAPGSVAANLPGDLFSDTTNHREYWCNATVGTAAPACTSVTTAGWTLLNGGGGGSGGFIYTGALAGIPASCTVGQVAFITDATAGQNQYNCAVSNLWTQNLNSGSGGASTALGNLAAVSINTSLLAQTGVDVGSTVKPFRNLFLFGSGTYGTNSFELTGTPSSTRTITIPDASGTLLLSGSATTTETFDLPSASCNRNGAGSAGQSIWWSTPNSPAAGICFGASYVGGVDLVNPGDTTRPHMIVPFGWSAGEVDFYLYGQNTASAASTFTIQTQCYSNSSTVGPGAPGSYNATQTFTTSPNGTSGLFVTKLANITMTGCAAGNILDIQIIKTSSSTGQDIVEGAYLTVVRSL